MVHCGMWEWCTVGFEQHLYWLYILQQNLMCPEIVDNAPNPRYIFPGGHSMKTSQNLMFLHIAARVWGQHT